MNQTQPFKPSADELFRNNQKFALRFGESHHELAPTRQLAIVTCMDSRIDAFAILGLRNGEAHVIRNAGGVITEDTVRSLCLSQRLMGTREIILVHHTDCGLEKLSEDSFKTQVEADIGIRPWWSLESFSGAFASVRQSIQRLYMSPFLVDKEHIRGFVYDVDNGRLREVVLGTS